MLLTWPKSSRHEVRKCLTSSLYAGFLTGDLGGRRGLSRAAAGDLHLSARDVELRRATRVVNTELLDAEQVVSGRDLRRNGRRVRSTHVPTSLATREGGADLLDLEPVAGSVCGSCRVDLCHVESDRSLVVDRLVCGERDGGASSHRDGCSAAT